MTTSPPYKLIKPFYPLRVGIDVDGVLADFGTPYRQKLIELAGEVPARVQRWDNAVDPDCWSWERPYGFSYATVEEFWRWSGDEGKHEFWLNLRPLQTYTQRDMLREFMQEHDVYFISKRPLNTKRVLEQWIQQYYAMVRPPTVVLAYEKGAAAKGLQLHAIIDDKPSNVQMVLRECGTTCIPMIYDQPWNKAFYDPYIPRVTSVEDALQIVENVAHD